MGGSFEQVSTDALRRAAPQLVDAVEPHLTAAANHLTQATGVEYGNFTAVSAVLAAAYVEACNVVATDLTEKKQLLHDFHDNLGSTAQAWDHAEHQNTIGPV